MYTCTIDNIQLLPTTKAFELENPSPTEKREISNLSTEMDDSTSVRPENDERIIEVAIIAGDPLPEETLTNDQEIYEGN